LTASLVRACIDWNAQRLRIRRIAALVVGRMGAHRRLRRRSRLSQGITARDLAQENDAGRLITQQEEKLGAREEAEP
jgi:hypothetical protein